MFGLSLKKKETELDKAIDAATGSLFLHEPETKEYAAIVKRLEKLYALKRNERRIRVSPDTIAIVCGNLMGILIIVNYERAHVLTSKAVTFVKAVPLKHPS